MKDDAISRQSTLEHVQRLDHLATLPDGDFVVRLSEVEDAIINGLSAPTVVAEGWLERNKDEILRAGYEGREVEFRIGGRMFMIREVSQ